MERLYGNNHYSGWFTCCQNAMTKEEQFIRVNDNFAENHVSNMFPKMTLFVPENRKSCLNENLYWKI